MLITSVIWPKKLNTSLNTLYKFQFKAAAVLVNSDKSKQNLKSVMLLCLLHHSPFVLNIDTLCCSVKGTINMGNNYT